MALTNDGAVSVDSGPGLPIDWAHLSRQTMGDDALAREVLAMFLSQADDVCGRIAGADVQERLFLAHGLKGSAQGVGAVAIAGCTSELEQSPADAAVIARLADNVEKLRAFLAATQA